MSYVGAIDQGTTGTRFFLFDEQLNVVDSAYLEHRQIYPQPGWVAHDANEIWENTLAVIEQVMDRNEDARNRLKAVGITNQRETVVAWDKITGQPLDDAIVWQCRRTADRCSSLRKTSSPEIHAKTGLVVDAYFSASKFEWLLQHSAEVKNAANNSSLAFGTIDSWLIWKLTGKHVTDASNASRTMLYNINSCEWDKGMLELFGVAKECLPKVVPSSSDTAYGIVAGASCPSLEGVIIGGAAGDQQAALFGQACFDPGEMKNTYGTGLFMLANIGEEPRFSDKGILTTIAWQLGKKITYALEGSVFIGGAAIQWLRDEIGIISTAAESEQLARSVPDNGEVYFVPAFVGLGAPWWDSSARGTIVGITRGTNKAHLARAALESIAYQTRDLVEAMESSNVKITKLRIDGGAVRNEFLVQFQSDILQRPVERPKNAETTACGAAMLAGLALGMWDSLDELRATWALDKSFKPKLTEEHTDRLYGCWKKAVTKARDWA